MTTIAVRAGVMASDSRATYESATGGHRVGPCTKLYRKCGDILGTAGEVPPALVFLDWYGKPASKAPEELRLGKAECTVLVLRKDGVVLLYEGSCYAEPFPGGTGNAGRSGNTSTSGTSRACNQAPPFGIRVPLARFTAA